MVSLISRRNLAKSNGGSLTVFRKQFEGSGAPPATRNFPSDPMRVSRPGRGRRGTAREPEAQFETETAPESRRRRAAVPQALDGGSDASRLIKLRC